LITKKACSLCEKVGGVLTSSPSRTNYELRLRQLENEPDGGEEFEAKDLDLGE
jgi:hypothetical protein